MGAIERLACGNRTPTPRRALTRRCGVALQLALRSVYRITLYVSGKTQTSSTPGWAEIHTEQKEGFCLYKVIVILLSSLLRVAALLHSPSSCTPFTRSRVTFPTSYIHNYILYPPVFRAHDVFDPIEEAPLVHLLHRRHQVEVVVLHQRQVLQCLHPHLDLQRH